MKWTLIVIFIAVIIVLASRKIIALLKSPVYNTFKDSIDKASVTFSIPTSRITAIVTHESSGNSDVPDSSTGAVGVMQVSPAALSDVNRFWGYQFTSNDRRDPDKNIFIGTAYLAYLYHSFQDLDLATQAYNFGIGNVLADHTAGRGYLQAVQKIENQILFT